MKGPPDPPRWSAGNEAPAALSSMLAGAQRESASDAELDALRARLAPVLDAPPPSAGLPALAKIASGALLAGLGVGISVLYLHHRPVQPNPDRAARPPVTSRVLSLPSSALRAPSAAPPVLARPPLEAVPAAATSSPPTTKKSIAGLQSAASNGANTTQAEAALLEQARADLSSNPAQALALTQRHAAQFPGGLLTQEREVIAISALRRLGRTPEAEARAAHFDARYPKSAHQQVVDSPAPR